MKYNNRKFVQYKTCFKYYCLLGYDAV